MELAKCNRLKMNIVEVPANKKRSKGQSNFKIFKWLKEYIRWYIWFGNFLVTKDPINLNE